MRDDYAKRYSNKLDEATDALTDAMLDAYKRTTGKKPSDNLRDKLWQLLQYETL